MSLILRFSKAMLIGTCLVFTSKTSVQAQELIFSDDFSDGFEKWQPTRDAGQYWHIVQGRAEVHIPTASTVTELVPKDHYWDAAWRNIEYSLDFTPIAGIDRNISFGIQDTCNWYETHFVENFFNLVRVQACRVPFSVNHDFLMTNNQTYHLRIRFLQGLISIYIDGQLIAVDQDWSFNQQFGKIGIKAGTGAEYPTVLAYDNIRVWQLADDGLGIPVLKQSDSRWAEVIYDTAQLWSEEPTIDRWGCALVSLVMIMKYHDLNYMPDGQLVTPITLNEWLINQVDGYIGDGLLNWVAAMRLTWQISQVYGTPKLEYTAMIGDSLIPAVNEITAYRPVILEIPGHFLVADGFSSDQSDLRIKDPAYIFSTLSQHQTTLLSTRRFQPSQTDLSYLLIAYPTGLNVTLTDAQHQLVSSAVHLLETIKKQSETSQDSTSIETLLLSKPTDSEYLISISQANISPFSIKVFTYNQRGEVTDLSQMGWVGKTPQWYQISFSTTDKGLIKPIYSWAAWRNELRQAYQQGQFGCWEAYWLLDTVATKAKSVAALNTSPFWRLQTLQLALFRPWIRSDVFRLLTHQLSKLRS